MHLGQEVSLWSGCLVINPGCEHQDAAGGSVPIVPMKCWAWLSSGSLLSAASAPLALGARQGCAQLPIVFSEPLGEVCVCQGERGSATAVTWTQLLHSLLPLGIFQATRSESGEGSEHCPSALELSLCKPAEKALPEGHPALGLAGGGSGAGGSSPGSQLGILQEQLPGAAEPSLLGHLGDPGQGFAV